MGKIADKAIVAGLLAAVVFTTVALGTVEAWSVAIFQLIVVILSLVWALKAILEKRLELRIPAEALPLGGLVLLGLTQSLALTGNSGQTRSLSMDVEATRGAAAMIFFLFVSFLIAANVFNTHKRLLTLENFLIIFGLALAVFALIQHFTWEGKMFWVRPTESGGTGGPFVNRNHFAGYMEMLIPIPVALALSHAMRGESRLFWGFAAAIMAVAEVASLSRGGMISLAAGLLFLAVLSVRKKSFGKSQKRESGFSFRPAYIIVLMLGAILAGVIWIGAESDILKRVSDDPLTSSQVTDRQAVWADTLTMFRANPVLGVGLGAFETVYPIYGQGNGSLLIQFAHNDYLQVLSDGGVVGGALALWFIVAVGRSLAGGLKSSEPLYSSFALGAGAGIFAILVHSLFDFNLQIPSNALLFLVLCAVVSNIGAASRTSN
ncbi:MAG TPA: O-antigen ligase family protein [Blastocatellia bacterium]|nr:O-antigen ligase family protein [Blastocatellia bacterium]